MRNGHLKKMLRRLGIPIVIYVIGITKVVLVTCCSNQGDVIVNLFNWKWTDVENECIRYLGQKGFCGVQVSPPIEHRVIRDLFNDRPWSERYEPVSYKMESRGGSKEQFASMVNTCNMAGVRIYVEVVLNHMVSIGAGTGVGSGGSAFDSDAMSFPEVPFTSADFNTCGCGTCCSLTCDVDDYLDDDEVRNCRSGDSLLDLAQSSESVMIAITNHLNELVDMGVAGFTIHNAKYMYPDDLESIISGVNDLNSTYFNESTRPFIMSELVDFNAEAVNGSTYLDMGLVTEYRYSTGLGEVFLGEMDLADLIEFGSDWGMVFDDEAVVFVDSYSSQRGIEHEGFNVLTFKNPVAYKCASVFALAWPYGLPRVMSSYEFESPQQGPPSYSGGDIADVPIDPDGSCSGGWVCEHRWKEIVNMVDFRKSVSGTAVDNWWDNGANQIAFSRGDRGFVAINYDKSMMTGSFQSNLPEGLYCDIISGELSVERCTGEYVYVDEGGMIELAIDPQEVNSAPMIVIYSGSLFLEPMTTEDPLATTEPSFETTEIPYVTTEAGSVLRTVILVNFGSQPGQDLFLRGGISEEVLPECSQTPDICQIPITHNILGSGEHYEKINAWRLGDTVLDWDGEESGQGNWQGNPAFGTPSVWTTNDPGHPGYQPINTYGPDHWMVDIEMDCSETVDGWFEFKSYVTNFPGGWEGDVTQDAMCGGTAGGSAPYPSNNHMARCGYMNLYTFNSGDCTIDNLL